MKQVIKSGRLSNGMELGKGKVVHLATECGFGKSICGVKPGKLSGSGFIETNKDVTCLKCINRKNLYYR